MRESARELVYYGDMKRIAAAIGAVLVLGALVWVLAFYWQNLRGIGPAITGPAEDIGRILEEEAPGPLTVPAGFRISVFAAGLGAPRDLAYDSGGALLVSVPSAGRVLALPDRDGNGKADEVVAVISGLRNPHGLEMRCRERCELYVAEENAVRVFEYDAMAFKATNGRKLFDLPSGGGHFTRSLLFMPYPNEDKLLISVGSSCNVCREEDWRRAKILIANADGSDLKEFAKGLRNAVFVAIHPVTGTIWATEMGRDLLGDDVPPDEINVIEEGKNYGWPTCYGKNVHDTEFDKNTYFRNPCMEPFEAPSFIDIPAHSAPLGLAFIPEEGWPEEYWYNMFVAYHGSWNRSVPTGYKITRYKLDAQGRYLGEEDFITGWLKDSSALGRPVDILAQPGGVLYISDDHAGVIYRVTR